jgi:hypothetical protein
MREFCPTVPVISDGELRSAPTNALIWSEAPLSSAA